MGQFGSKRRQAEAKYRAFVEAGLRQKDIWKKVKGQSILGEDDFAEGLFKYVKGFEDVKKIPKNQCYMGRPALLEIFRGVTRDNRTRATAVRNAVYEHGYSQKEVANFLGIHYSTISRTVKKRKCTEQDLPRILLVLLRSEAIKSKVMTWPGDIAPALGLQLWDRI